MTKHIDEIVELFYTAIMKESSLTSIINDHSSVSRLGNVLKQHLLELLAGQIDDSYVARRKQVARQMGLVRNTTRRLLSLEKQIVLKVL